MSPKRHPVNVEGYDGSLAELARAIGCLRYDKLAELLYALTQDLTRQQLADTKRKRPRLAEQLKFSVSNLRRVVTHVRIAWKLCEPFEPMDIVFNEMTRFPLVASRTGLLVQFPPGLLVERGDVVDCRDGKFYLNDRPIVRVDIA